MKYRSLPILNESVPPEEVRLTLIQDRLLRHEVGIPPGSVSEDFGAHAAEDIRWLLEHVEAILDVTQDLRTNRERERQEQLEAIRTKLMDSKALLREVVCEADLVIERFGACQKKVDELESKPEVRLAAVQADLKAAQFELSKLRLENSRLKDQLSTLPPTWLERVTRRS
jgi:hypothetical protein